MDPCPFVRVLVGNLALRIPVAARPSRSGVHPSSTPCYCKIKLGKLPPQTAPVPLAQQDGAPAPAPASGTASSAPEQQQIPPAAQGLAASFDLGPAELYGAKNKKSKKNQPQTQQQKDGSRVLVLKVEIYTGRRGTTCGLNSGRLLGKVTVPVDLDAATEGGRGYVVYHSGWVSIGGGGQKRSKGSATAATAGSASSPNSTTSSPPSSSSSSASAEVHLTVRSEPDPRFVFEFDGEPECSPQVFQVQGARRQPVFTCKFSCRNPSSIDHRSSSMQTDYGTGSRGGTNGWLRGSFGALSDRDHQRAGNGKERKGWSVTVHDLSGSPVALASMVTPFVASPGSDRVSRSNPGAWLILRPGDGTWKPWGRLEAWRERGGSNDGLGCRFELLPDASGAAMDGTGVLLSEATLSARKGGKFSIDLTSSASAANAGTALGSTSFGHQHHVGRSRSGSRSATPGCSPRGSGDLAGLLQHPAFGSGSHFRGFVMSSTVQGEGKCSKPGVEIGVQNVGCAEDAAAFVALAAAVDLSMDACRLFSHKLRKELSHNQQEQML